MREGPMHPRDFARPPVDSDLHGAARPVGAGKIDAFLDLDPIFVGVESPDVAVRKHEHGAMTVGQLVGLDGWMQMKPHRELIRHVLRDQVAVGGDKQIFAVDAIAGQRKL